MTGVLSRIWSRREWLAGLVWSGHRLTRRPLTVSTEPPPAVPRVNGGINVHPVRRLEDLDRLPVILPELIDLQLRAVYELGFAQMRTALAIDADGLGRDFLAAIPYVRAARALGIDVLGIVSNLDTGPHVARALGRSLPRARVVQAVAALFAGPVQPLPGVSRAGGFAVQVLNEPTRQNDLPPREYVTHFLRPTHDDFRRWAPEVPIVSAASVGDRNGVLRLREMFRAGLERYCDVVALHVYDQVIIRQFSGLATRPIWVTETGVPGPDRHLDWTTIIDEELRRWLPTLERIYYYVLFDLHPNRHRLFELSGDQQRGFSSRVESTALVAHLTGRVEEALAGRVPAAFDTLIPNITTYLATDDDREVMASADLLRFIA
jgi:hypothetical protein